MNGTGGHWYVQLADGDVHRVTLDQLDEGFQAGHIDTNTMVLAAGATRWATLGQVAGIDDAAPTQASPSNPAPTPLAASVGPSHATRPAYLATRPYVAPRAPLASEPPSRHEAPVYSHRPVSVDLSELELAAGLPRRSGKRWFATLVALAIVVGSGVVSVKRPTLMQPYLNRLGIHRMVTKTMAAVVARPRLIGTDSPPPVGPRATDPVFIPPATTPTPATPASVPAPSSSANQPAIDKQVQPKTRASKAHAPTVPPHASPKSPTFTTGGSHYDPLNSSI